MFYIQNSRGYYLEWADSTSCTWSAFQECAKSFGSYSSAKRAISHLPVSYVYVHGVHVVHEVPLL